VTGIQHRWDCPVRTRGIRASLAETVVVVGRTEARRCLYCHRTALTERRFLTSAPTEEDRP
jgi:hypothetical protein